MRPRTIIAAATIGWLSWCAGAMPGLSAEELAAPAPKELLYDPQNRRDPFVALVQDGKLVGVPRALSGSGNASELTLYGIVWDAGGHSIALINDTEAKVGDRVGDYRVEEIRKDVVVVSNGDQRLELQIKF